MRDEIGGSGRGIQALGKVRFEAPEVGGTGGRGANVCRPSNTDRELLSGRSAVQGKLLLRQDHVGSLAILRRRARHFLMASQRRISQLAILSPACSLPTFRPAIDRR